ncbi:hypothetical protein Q669_28960 [Labrenzia sp. C1B10]|uniref:DUF4962 domain-containing protein n=1 Tax=unclassified Labrenzia TaxID=2648686 RepID=UPI0003B85030|nr:MULTISPECIES: DUF4962 domain-containing protein [unclassified Labrenzia]ERP96404.1 hypothetical protein Q669_28960 [Labrenzia sp. C1B10]ERS06919.1 hypothetical protein Q675_24815 [Labrenzia sp. C1B70]
MAVNKKKSQQKQIGSHSLLQPEENLLTVRYAPAPGQIVRENPPRFQWIPPQIGRHVYDLELRPLAADGREAGEPVLFNKIQFPFFTPDRAVSPGQYSWRYRTSANGIGPSDWSTWRSFEVCASAIVAPFTYDRKKATGMRPRLSIAADRHELLIPRLDELPEWQKFMERSVRPWISREIPGEPARYPNDVRTPAMWRQSYITCQEVFYGIRNLSLAGVLLRERELIDRARDWLLSVAEWDTEGSTSRSYNDEAAFRVAAALAWGYDWLRTELSAEDAETVRLSLTTRGRQVARHIMHASRVDTFPYDSHAVRAVSAVLVPVGLALAGEDPEGTEWLDFAANYLAGPYSAWGDQSGGWAEGIHYWTTAMCYALEAATLLRNATGLDLFKRPFFRNTGTFPVFCRPAWTRRATFGDDATLGDAPSPKIARNMRLLAAATENPRFAGYANQIEELSDSDESAFYNYGWWDLNFDDLLREASFGSLEAAPMPANPQLQVFREVGWASLQSRMDDPGHQIHCVFKSSPFGSISHSHADQNAICMSAFGEDLLVQSGHYIAHNSSMHRNWRRQTISKNALLINGKGQYAGDDKFRSRQASGTILGYGSETYHQWVAGDASEAYRSLSPEIIQVERQVHMVFGAAIIVVDLVTARSPVVVTWLGHSYGSIKAGELSSTITGQQADLCVEVLFSEAQIASLSTKAGFDNVSRQEIEGLDISRRLEIKTSLARQHVLATMLTPLKKGDAPKVLSFVEDQGFGKTLYCISSEQCNPVKIPLTSRRNCSNSG